MVNGILIIDKEEGWTSHDVVAKLRGVLGEKRIGHGGTLDPMATGVLPVFIGRATRAAGLFPDAEKEYIAVLRLGLVTDTQDTTGTVLEERPVHATYAQLASALEEFRGEIMQIPPMYSAVKQGGRKLYELARAGKEVERMPRPVVIHKLELLEQTSPVEYTLRVVCSKGTYIRTLCHDIGAALSCGGAMSALRRTRVGAFGLDRAFTMRQICANPDPRALIMPVDAAFVQYPAIIVDGGALRGVKNGNDVSWSAPPGVYRVYDPSGGFLLLGRLEEGRLFTIKSFFEV